MKQKIECRVISQKEIAPAIYDLWIETALAKEAKAGQFIGVFPKDKSTLLPRPISICQVSDKKDALRIVYRIAGQGTKEFSTLKEGDCVQIMGPLGNGFPVEQGMGKRVFLMGGGIGIPPMLELARELDAMAEKPMGQDTLEDGVEKNSLEQDVLVDGIEKKRIVAVAGDKASSVTRLMSIVGYRDADTFLSDELGKYSEVYIASEDGSVGTKGNVMNAINENGLKADVIFACGPMPMLRAIKAFAQEQGIPAYISLEEHMACGVGACLGCVVKTKEVDHHSHVNNARICTDGPVFEAGDVEI